MNNKLRIYIIITLLFGLGIGGYLFRDKLAFAGILDNNTNCFSRTSATSSVTNYIYMATSTATSTPGGCSVNRADTYALHLSYVASTTGAVGSTGSAATIAVEFSYNGGDLFQLTNSSSFTGGQVTKIPEMELISPNTSATTTYALTYTDMPGKFVRFNLRQVQGNKTDNGAYWWTLVKREPQN